MRVLVKCFLCKAQLDESDATVLYLHPVGEACPVRVTDRFGVALDDVYEVERTDQGVTIYERAVAPVASVEAPMAFGPFDEPITAPVDWALDLGEMAAEAVETVEAVNATGEVDGFFGPSRLLMEPEPPLSVKERFRLPMASTAPPKPAKPTKPTKPTKNPLTVKEWIPNPSDFEITLIDPRNHDEAIAELFAEAGTPKLGGASGEAGWSSFSTFQRCPYLWYRNYFVGDRNHDPAKPLIVGSLLHLFLAFHYQAKIESTYPLTPNGAFNALKEKGIHADALAEAWRLYEGYQALYEDEPYLTPLAVEYLAADTRSKESCRYDMIARVTADHPLAVCVEATENPHNVVYKPLAEGVYVWEHKCLPADAVIWDYNTNRQWTVGELYRFGIAPKVLAFDQTTEQLVRAQADEIHPEQVREVFEVETQQGRRLRTSNNHPFLTADGWKAADQLTTDDWLAVPSTTSVGEFVSPFSDFEVQLVGYLVSEGGLTGSGGITFTQCEGGVLTDFLTMVDNLGIDPAEYSIRHDKDGTAVCVTFRTAKKTFVREFAQTHGMYGKRSHEQTIPVAFRSLPDRQTGILLGALWDGDGACEIQDRYSRPLVCLRYTSTSRTLAEDIQALLLRFGVTSSITGQWQKLPDGRDYVSFKVTIVSRTAKRRFCEALRDGTIQSVRVGVNAQKMLDLIDPDDDALIPGALVRSRLDSVAKSHRGKLAQRLRQGAGLERGGLERTFGLKFSSDVTWERVGKISMVGKERMYDISVPGVNTFVANDLITHNTSGRRDEISLTGWANDGEILGQQMLWRRLGLDEKFGPLQGTIVNLIGKQKNPSFDRILIPVKQTQYQQHARDLKVWAAFRQLCIAQDSFPRARANCVGRWGKCSQWDHCRGGKGSETE